jgi:hypothetical protein
MEPTPPRHLKIGDNLNGTIVRSLGGRRFAVRSSQVPRGWKVELHTRRPELIQDGANISAWIAKIAPLQGEVLVHDGDFGRLPISAAMRSRYIASLQALLGQGELTGDLLADARTMLVRIGTQQQADWLTVWRVLGEPKSGEVKELLAAVDGLRKARKEDPESLPQLHERLIHRYGGMLEGAVERLEKGSV